MLTTMAGRRPVETQSKHKSLPVEI